MRKLISQYRKDKETIKIRKAGDTSEGTFFFSSTWFSLDLNQAPSLITQIALDDGQIDIFVLPNRLLIQIVEIKEHTIAVLDEWISPEINMAAKQPYVCDFSWSDRAISKLHINGAEIPKNIHCEKIEFPVVKDDIDTLPETKVPQVDFDLRVAGEDIFFRQFRQVATRLERAIKNLCPSKPEYLLDAITCVRILLTGTEKRGGRLLFACAKKFNIIPCVYVVPLPDGFDFPDLGLNETIIHVNATAVPCGKNNLLVPLSDWMNEPALLIGGKVKLRHWQLIREVSDNFSVHSETLGHSEIWSFVNMYSSELNFSLLNQALMTYSNLSIDLCKIIVKQAHLNAA